MGNKLYIVATDNRSWERNIDRGHGLQIVATDKESCARFNLFSQSTDNEIKNINYIRPKRVIVGHFVLYIFY